MRCRLGSFLPRPGSGDFARLLYHHRSAGVMTRALEEMLGVRMSQASPVKRGEVAAFPDLLEALGPGHADRAWVEPVAAEMEATRSAGTELRLLACEYEAGSDGFLTLAASAPERRFELFEGDWMQIGFAASRQGDGPVRAWPRLLREVCRNGSLVCVAEFERHEGATGITDAVRRFLTPETYEPAIATLRETRNERVHDPRSFLDEFGRIDDHTWVLRPHMESIEDRYYDEDDRSAYGLVNAITATARDVEDWTERLALEEFAGRIAWLRRPTPSREGAEALSLV